MKMFFPPWTTVEAIGLIVLALLMVVLTWIPQRWDGRRERGGRSDRERRGRDSRSMTTNEHAWSLAWQRSHSSKLSRLSSVSELRNQPEGSINSHRLPTMQRQETCYSWFSSRLCCESFIYTQKSCRVCTVESHQNLSDHVRILLNRHIFNLNK